MYRFIDPDEDSFLKNDETYQRIIKQLNPFISNLNLEDKECMLKMLSNCYHKYHNSIGLNHKMIGLMFSTMMALLIEQSGEIERIGLSTTTRDN